MHTIVFILGFFLREEVGEKIYLLSNHLIFFNFGIFINQRSEYVGQIILDHGGMLTL